MNLLADNAHPILVAFGGGVNSTAMLCGFHERGIAPAQICFADTGGEMPHTYEHVAEMDAKSREWWGVGIETVRKLYRGEFEGLEGECLRAKQLPSLAYGGKHCSIKYKTDPQTRSNRVWMKDRGVTEAAKAIGFGADEAWRYKEKFDVLTLNKKARIYSIYPLMEWNWRRSDCIAAIERHGITSPGKSSCFFCPAKKRGEVLKLRAEHPALFDRGVAMERNSISRKPEHDAAGLGRGLHFGASWEDMANADDAQGKLFDWVGEHASMDAPCGCYDGGEA